jgi:hypothetical protein
MGVNLRHTMTQQTGKQSVTPRTKIENTWARLEGEAVTLKAMVGGQFVSTGFPPIDENGNLIPNATVDIQCAKDPANYGILQYATHNLAQNNALTPMRAGWPYINHVASETLTGYQMASAWGNAADLLKAGNLGIQAGAKYLEFYMSDVIDPNQADALAQLHSSIGSN